MIIAKKKWNDHSLPAGFFDPRQFPLMGQVAKVDPAKAKLAHIGMGPAVDSIPQFQAVGVRIEREFA
jgi:hypothetical protein